MKFNFVAKDRAGADIVGVRDAADEFALARDLRKDGVMLVSAKAESAKRGILHSSIGGAFSRVTLKDQVLFSSNLSSMITAGLPLGRSLAILKQQTKKARLLKVLTGVAEAIDMGSSLSSSLKKFPKDFPEIIVAMVRAGEESGNLPHSLLQASENLKRRYLLGRRVRGALAYPIIVSLVMLLVSIIVLVYVVPSITATFSEFGIELPLLTRIVIALSSFLMNHPVSLLIGAAALVVAAGAALHTAQGRRARDFVLLHMPIMSPLVKEVYSTVVCGTLSSLLRAGVEVIETIAITKDIAQNVFYKDMLADAEMRLQKGISLHAIFKERGDLYPSFVAEMAEVGDETGTLPDMLARIADFYDEHITEVTKNISTLVEPVMMVVIGLFVGLFALAVLQPLYSMSSII
ncbi:MAG: type II secretion system F family protein [Candidatus Vogelbacteria bacterium]|nr:type II secretion system F family protein [Candidatus Vogelbacteria bacterium]